MQPKHSNKKEAASGNPLATACLQIFLLVFIFSGIDGSCTLSLAQNHGQVSGRLMSSSAPLSLGTLSFFNADHGSDPEDQLILRIPERTALVDAQGRFAVDIQFGRYLLGYFPDQQKTHPGLPNEITLASLAGEGPAKRFILHVTSPQIDIGNISFYPVKRTPVSPSFTVTGTVRKKSGKPAHGITVIAKKDFDSFRPQFISKQTDTSGSYALTLPPGSYYLFARHRLKNFGRPDIGEYFGIFGVAGAAGEFGRFPITKDQNIAIHGESGQTIADTDITVFKIPDPADQKETLKAGGKR